VADGSVEAVSRRVACSGVRFGGWAEKARFATHEDRSLTSDKRVSRAVVI